MQINWALDAQGLDNAHIDILNDMPTWLHEVNIWIQDLLQEGEVWSSSRTAMSAIRGHHRLFGGIGKYTLSEIFHMAGKCFTLVTLDYYDIDYMSIGIPPYITIFQLVGNIARSARFVAAVIAYSYKIHADSM